MLKTAEKKSDHDTIAEAYPDEVKLADAFGREVIITDTGTYRFKQNFAVDTYVHAGTDKNGRILPAPMDLNKLWIKAHQQSVFPLVDMMKFYMDMGYSLGGFCEVFGQSEAIDWGLPGALAYDDDNHDEYVQTPIDWMVANLHRN